MSPDFILFPKILLALPNTRTPFNALNSFRIMAHENCYVKHIYFCNANYLQALFISLIGALGIVWAAYAAWKALKKGKRK